jgi:integrase/recombinase XerD
VVFPAAPFWLMIATVFMHNLEEYLDAYMKAAGIGEFSGTPLFRSASGRTGTLTEKPMNRIDAWRMIQRRAAELGSKVKVGCHTFRRA